MKEQYGLLQQEYEDQKLRAKDKIQALEKQFKDKEKEKKHLEEINALDKDEIEKLKREIERLKNEITKLKEQITKIESLSHLKGKMEEVE